MSFMFVGIKMISGTEWDSTKLFPFSKYYKETLKKNIPRVPNNKYLMWYLSWELVRLVEFKIIVSNCYNLSCNTVGPPKTSFGSTAPNISCPRYCISYIVIEPAYIQDLSCNISKCSKYSWITWGP
jgi:hypothetical protein